MAKQYRAVTRIEHGEQDYDSENNPVPGSNRVVTFEPGEIVKGLKGEDMAKLWDAGALEEAGEAPEPPQAPVVVETPKASEGGEPKTEGDGSA